MFDIILSRWINFTINDKCYFEYCNLDLDYDFALYMFVDANQTERCGV